MPRIVSGPDSAHRISENDTSDTIELIAPMASPAELDVKESTSSWIRWSGLSTRVALCRPRW